MNVRFLCPKKNELVVTDIAPTREVLQEHWSKVISCRCPHCGEIHSFSVRDAYIDGILSATTQDQRDLDNPLVRFAHFERQRLEAATPAATISLSTTRHHVVGRRGSDDQPHLRRHLANSFMLFRNAPRGLALTGEIRRPDVAGDGGNESLERIVHGPVPDRLASIRRIVSFKVLGRAGAARDRDTNPPDRIAVFVRFGASNPGDRRRKIGRRVPQRAFRHGTCDLTGYRPLLAQQVRRNPEGAILLRLRIGDKPAMKTQARARRVGQALGQGAGRARLRRDERQLPDAQQVKQVLGQLPDVAAHA
jgi:hypothetical protein